MICQVKLSALFQSNWDSVALECTSIQKTRSEQNVLKTLFPIHGHITWTLYAYNYDTFPHELLIASQSFKNIQECIGCSFSFNGVVFNVSFHFPSNARLYRIPTKESKFIDLYKSNRTLDASHCYKAITSSLQKLAMKNYHHYSSLNVIHNCPWNHSIGIEHMLKKRLVNRFKAHAEYYKRLSDSEFNSIAEHKLLCITENGKPFEYFVFSTGVPKTTHRQLSRQYAPKSDQLDSLVPAISALGSRQLQYNLTRQFHQVQKDVLELKIIAKSHIGYEESANRVHVIMIKLGKSLEALKNTIRLLTSLSSEYLQVYTEFVEELGVLLRDNQLHMPSIEKQAKCLFLQSEFLLQELLVSSKTTGELDESFFKYVAFIVTSFLNWLQTASAHCNFREIFRYMRKVGLAVYDFEGASDILNIDHLNLSLILDKNQKECTFNSSLMTINVPVEESILLESEKSLCQIRVHIFSQHQNNERTCREYLDTHGGLLPNKPETPADFRKYVNSFHLLQFGALISITTDTHFTGFHQTELEVLEKFNLDILLN